MTDYFISFVSSFIRVIAEFINVIVYFINNVLTGKQYPFDVSLAVELVLGAIGFYSSTVKKILACKP